MGYKRYIPTYTSYNACGCEFEVEAWIDYGCCELCGESVEVGGTRIIKLCSEHGG